MRLHVLVLPGDGIGPEVVREAEKVLRAVAQAFGHTLLLEEALVGGASIVAFGEPATPALLGRAREAGAVLLGAVGHPEWDALPPARRPEAGLLRLREAMEVFANLRPVKAHAVLEAASPLKSERVRGTDLLIVRELTGGIYFGNPRGSHGQGVARQAFNTLTYSYDEILRISRLGFELARSRRRRLASVDKANVLEVSQLWRVVVNELAPEFPDVTVEHLYVDNAAMQLVLNPLRFDVLLTENMFGDILSDEAAVLAGSIGLLPSASLGARRADGTYPGLYEPIHGSAPTLVGKGVANPLGTLGSVALMLRWSFGLTEAAHALETALDAVVASGPWTPDLGGQATTQQVGDALVARLRAGAGAAS